MQIDPTSSIQPNLRKAEDSLASGDRAGALRSMQDAVTLSGSGDDIGGLMSVWKKVASLLTGGEASSQPVNAAGKGRAGGGGKGRPAPAPKPDPAPAPRPNPGNGKGRPRPK